MVEREPYSPTGQEEGSRGKESREKQKRKAKVPCRLGVENMVSGDWPWGDVEW